LVGLFPFMHRLAEEIAAEISASRACKQDAPA